VLPAHRAQSIQRPGAKEAEVAHLGPQARIGEPPYERVEAARCDSPPRRARCAETISGGGGPFRGAARADPEGRRRGRRPLCLGRSRVRR
jgi:hypothetical protein